MATASEVLTSARTHLNDDAAINWQDPILFPKLQEAHRELQLKLRAYGIPTVTSVSAILTVPANVTDLTLVSGYPSDLIEPILLKERSVNQQQYDFVEMRECDFIPDVQKSDYLKYWAWLGEKIILLGATNAQQVYIRYRRKLTLPVALTDSIGILLGESYLSYRVAGLAMASANQRDRAEDLNAQAEGNIELIIGAAVKEMQNLPVRKQGYQRRGNRERMSWI